MIRFTCPCGKKLKAPASAAGKVVTCPGCGRPLPVPASPEPAEPPADAEEVVYQPDPPAPDEPDKEPSADRVPLDLEDDPDDEPVRLPRRRSRSPLPFVLIGVGLLAGVALLMVVLAYQRTRRAAHQKASPDTTRSDPRERPGPDWNRYRGRAAADEDDDPAAVRRSLFSTAILGMVCAGFLLYWALIFALAVWIVRDARNRSVENGVVWMLLVFPLNVLALLIYLVARPQGQLVGCRRCGNRHLPYVAYCPHCHHRT